MARYFGGDGERKLPKIIERELWDRIIEAAGLDRSQPLLANRDEAILALLYGSGIRCCELVGLNVEDACSYDPEVGWVPKGILTVRKAKRKKERLAPLADFALAPLEAYLDVRPQVAPGDEPDPRDEGPFPLFVSRKQVYGGRLDTSAVRRLYKLTSIRAGFGREGHPHMSRHSNATAQVKRVGETGGSLYEVAENLGHASLDTLKIYVHLAAEDRRRRMAEL